ATAVLKNDLIALQSSNGAADRKRIGGARNRDFGNVGRSDGARPARDSTCLRGLRRLRLHLHVVRGTSRYRSSKLECAIRLHRQIVTTVIGKDEPGSGESADSTGYLECRCWGCCIRTP